VSGPHQTSNLIGGEWRDAGARLDVLDPADQRSVVGTVPAMSAAELDGVYEAAAAGAATWAATSSVGRGQVLADAGHLLHRRRGEIAPLLSAEMGKTLAEAEIEVTKSAHQFEFFAGLGRAAQGEVLAHENAAVTAYTRYEPHGVVLAITPWNDPLLTPARKLAPALLAGNSVILKPASYTPLVALELARCLDDAGLPEGVLNTVTGSAAELSEGLLSNPSLRAVSFTGSNSVGATIRSVLAPTGVELLAELGGKNATVVLADADLDRAADTIAVTAFAQAGQRCTATSRVVVERSVHDALVDRLRRRAESLTLGPGTDPTTKMGPVVSMSHCEEVLGYLERAITEGAKVATGGRRATEGDLGQGCFVAPTVLTEVDTLSEVWTDEVFGPVLCVVAVADLTEAVAVVNDSSYGLAAGLFSNDLRAVNRFVAEVDAGQVAVNLPTSGWDVHMPFGGFKASGLGPKEQGIEGLSFYRRVKTTAIAA
jgi:aldehyde dehydrogenase (NAD+)